jgi:Protein of unknown function (DUF3106)
MRFLVPVAALILSLTLAPVVSAGQGRRGGGMKGRAPRSEKASKPAKTPIDDFEKMSPEERQKALDRLPPKQRQQVEERLKNFNQLPPGQQQSLKNMYNRLNQLPPARQEVVRGALTKFAEQPADRQQAMRQELQGMAGLPEQERQARLANPEFRSKFNGQEQGIVRDMSDLLPPGL